MKRVVRSLLLFFCATLFMLSESVCVCVLRVRADDTPTYTIYEANTCVIAGQSNNFWQSFSATKNLRAVTLLQYNTLFTYFVSDEMFYYNSSSSNSTPPSSCNVPSSITSNPSTKTVNGTTYYFFGVGFGEPPRWSTPYTPITISNSDDQQSMAIYYTYGEGAVDPVEPVTWGLVDLEGYQTQVAGQGNASINNVDVISWNDTFDTNSNDISTGNVRVRYVPGYYRATSKQNLLAQTYQDFVLDIISAVNGDVYPVSDGSASFRWGDVIGSLSIPFYSIYNLTNSTEGWLKRGWIYEVRLEIDDYIGEWQTVYSSTSSGVENDMTIVNTTVITQETITAIQNINSINGTTNIWIINGTPVDPNPEYEPPASNDEKPWWVYLLEMINNTLGIQNEYINEGTDESIEIVNNFEEDHNDLNITVNDYDDIEDTIVNDMNDNLDDLDIESDLIENNSFLSSARWVAEQYTRITTDNPIGSILKFSLVLGFVMIFLGRFK